MSIDRVEDTSSYSYNDVTLNDSNKDDTVDESDLNLLLTSTIKSYSKLSIRKRYVIVFILFLANLLNYIDRSSLSGILINVKEEFGMDDKGTALVNSIFLVAYTIFSPLFGYLGDHYSRKWLIIVGLLFWSIFTLLGSYVPATHPKAFYLTRSLVGIGEASLSTLGFPLVGDMFEGTLQARMLAAYLLALPIGNGVGYIVGTAIQTYFKNWRYVLRLTPGLGIIVAVFCACFIVDIPYEDPKARVTDNDYIVSKSVLNNETVKPTHNNDPIINSNTTCLNNLKIFFNSIWNDIKYCFKIKSFILSTLGYAETAFVMGIMQVWIPTFMTYSNYIHNNEENNKSQLSVGVTFGASCIVCGLIGTVIGSELSNRLRIYTENSETYLCTVVLFICSFCCYMGIIINPYSLPASWVFTFLGVFLICITWTPNSIILMSVISIRHRGLASAIQIILIHAIGDAISPLIVGAISDILRKKNNIIENYSSLYHSLLICPYFMLLAATLYLWSTFYYPHDKK